MIEVGMRDQNLLEREAVCLDDLQHAIEITTRIDDRCTPRPLTPDNGAVLLKAVTGTTSSFMRADFTP